MILEIILIALLGFVPAGLHGASVAPADSDSGQRLEFFNDTEHFQLYEFIPKGRGPLVAMGLKSGDRTSFSLPPAVEYERYVEQVPGAYFKNISEKKVLVANGHDCFVGLRAKGFPYLLKIVDPFSIAIIDLTGFWLSTSVQDLEIVAPVFGCVQCLVSPPAGGIKWLMYALVEHPLAGLTDALRRSLAVDSTPDDAASVVSQPIDDAPETEE